MDTKTKFLSLLITLGIITSMMATCKKSECISNSYSLKESWSITPERDSINVGDTLNFISKFLIQPFDYNSNKNVNFGGGASVNTTLVIYCLRPNATNVLSGRDSFNFLELKGKVVSDPNPINNHIKQVYHEEVNNNYELNFKMVALKKGIFAIILSDGLAIKKNGTPCDDGAGILYTNANTNNHVYYQEQFYGTTNIPPSNRTHTYCFKVK